MHMVVVDGVLFAHPSIIIGKWAFDLLHFYWVKRMKNYNVYCYINHVEIEELKVGFNHMRKNYGLRSKFHYECEVVCGIINESFINCVGSHGNLAITTFWEAIVCPKDTHYKWHAWDCMFGVCKDSGVDNLALCPNEEEDTLLAIVCWKCFNMEKVAIKKGEGKKRINSCKYWKLIPWNFLHFEA